MKKKFKIVFLCIGCLIFAIFIVLFIKNSTSDAYNALVCTVNQTDGAKSANITNTYTILENNKLHVDAVVELSFLNAAEADKYEEIVTRAFFKDTISRDGNKIIIISDKEDADNELTLEEIKRQQEESNFDCNYK